MKLISSDHPLSTQRPERLQLVFQDDHLEEMQAFAVRWTAAQPAVTAFIATLVRRHHDAEDILQRTAASLVAMRGNYDPSKSFVTWAIGVARIEVLRYRQESRRDKTVFDTETVEAIAGAFERAESDLPALKAALERCIEKIKGGLREIFEMHYVHNMRAKTIALKLGRTTAAVFLSLHRGRASVRQCMERSMETGGVL